MEKIIVWKGTPKEIESITTVQIAIEKMCETMEDCQSCPFARDNGCVTDEINEQIDEVMEYNEKYYS